MATLTTSYQKVKETKMGSWGYGTLYLRTYAKVDSQSADKNSSKVSIQSRIYNNGTYCWSGNCYNTLMGEKKKNNVSIDFTGNSEITLGTVTKDYTHDNDGNKSISLTNSFKCYALSGTFTADVNVDLPKINRNDKATGLDFDIGNSTTITITRYNSSFIRTVVATLGSFSETLLEKGAETEITWTPKASELYKQIPNTNTGSIKLTTTTYDSNGNVIGSPVETTFNCRVTNSNPIVSAVSITASNPIISSDLLIRYVTIPKFTITASPQNSATIAKYEVTELSSTTLTSTSNVVTATTAVKNNSFTVVVTDSRGNSTPVIVSSTNFVPYFLRAISSAKVNRTGEGLDKVEAVVDGVWYNETLGTQPNTMAIYYRYKVTGGEYGEYKLLTATSQPSNFSLTLDLDDTYDTNQVYVIEFRFDDYLGASKLEATLPKAIPLTDHWTENDKDYYNINAELQQYGIPIVKEQNILWEGASYMNEGQTATLNGKVSEQHSGVVLVWSRYTNDTAQNDSFNFTFIPKSFVEMWGGYGTTSIIAGSGFNPIGSKYVYVSDTKVTGNAINNQSSKTVNGITFVNNNFVLRYVIGV